MSAGHGFGGNVPIDLKGKMTQVGDQIGNVNRGIPGGYRIGVVDRGDVAPRSFATEHYPNNSEVDYRAVARDKRKQDDFPSLTSQIFNVPLERDKPGQLPQAYGSDRYIMTTPSTHNEAAAHKPKHYTTTTQLSFGGYRLD